MREEGASLQVPVRTICMSSKGEFSMMSLWIPGQGNAGMTGLSDGQGGEPGGWGTLKSKTEP